MRRVNLLPEQFRHLAAQRRQRRRRVLLLVTTSVAIVLWAGALWLQTVRLDRQIVSLQRDVQPVREHRRRMDQLEHTYQQLVHTEHVLATYRNPAPPAAIFAALSKYMPDDTIAQRITIETPAAVLPGGIEHRVRHDAGRLGPSIGIRVEGVAATEVATPAMLDRLTTESPFMEVRLISNEAAHHVGQRRESFAISMQLPLRLKSNRASAEERVEP